MRLPPFNDFYRKTKQAIIERPVHCVFYSHNWTIYDLEALGLVKPKVDIIIELATQSALAATLNPSNKHHETLLGLLQPNLHLHQLGAFFKEINSLVVLAPHQTVNFNSLLSALALVITDDSSIEKAVVLVNINDAALFTLAYPYMRYFSIVWDIADYPNKNLVDLAQLLATEQCLTVQNWRGFYLSNHQKRLLPDSQAREALLKQLIDEFPFVKAN